MGKTGDFSVKYSVVLTGKCVSGFDVENVKKSLNSIFYSNKLSDERLVTMFSGNKADILRGTSYEKAIQIRTRLLQIGAEAEVIDNSTGGIIDEKPMSFKNVQKEELLDMEPTTPQEEASQHQPAKRSSDSTGKNTETDNDVNKKHGKTVYPEGTEDYVFKKSYEFIGRMGEKVILEKDVITLCQYKGGVGSNIKKVSSVLNALSPPNQANTIEDDGLAVKTIFIKNIVAYHLREATALIKGHFQIMLACGNNASYIIHFDKDKQHQFEKLASYIKYYIAGEPQEFSIDKALKSVPEPMTVASSSPSTVYSETITDPDNNIYKTIQIGTQIWTVENWRSTKYGDGTPIPHVTASREWRRLSTPAYCWYNNDSEQGYGALYNWWVVDPANPKRIAPEGWRVPTDEDWAVLQSYLINNGHNWDGSTTVNKIGKALASNGGEWANNGRQGYVGNDQGSNNSSGISALPGGCRDYNAKFNSVGLYGFGWSATENDESNAYSRGLSYDNELLNRFDYYKSAGFSVRLVGYIE